MNRIINDELAHFVLVLVTHPYDSIENLVNVYIDKELSTLYIESRTKEATLKTYIWFSHEGNVFYELPLTPEVQKIVKLMYEGQWKFLLQSYPDEVNTICLLSGLNYNKKKYGQDDNGNNVTTTATSLTLLKLLRDKEAYNVLNDMASEYNTTIDRDDEYLMPMKDNPILFIEDRLGNNYQEIYDNYYQIKLRRNHAVRSSQTVSSRFVD